MRFAVYSRKSKFTGKGDSVENQVKLCVEYIERYYGGDTHEITVFEDEGFSGKNLQRPEFMRMMSLARKKRFDYVVCYRLDRISRNVSDFSRLIEEFSKYKVSFICIREQFDTSTPMGRAMMYIASVFAQLERETIAERIRDNMLMLAKTGRWLGGSTPLGFESAKVSRKSPDGKEQISFKLIPAVSEQDTVRLIYRQYLQLKSLSGLEAFLTQNGFKTRKDKNFTAAGLREILTNPVYCVADSAAYKYFSAHNADICGEQSAFCGKYGVAAYNRTSNEDRMQIKNNISQWIITPGRHKGIIESSDWIRAQDIIKSNMPKKYGGRVQNQASLLSGLLVCGECGSFMRPKVNSNRSPDEDGNQVYSYMCELKKKSKRTSCKIPNLNGNRLDKLVCEEIIKFDIDGALINTKLGKLKKSLSHNGSLAQISLEAIQAQIKERESQIDECLKLLIKSPGKRSKLYEYSEKKIEALDQELADLKKEEYKLIQKNELSGSCQADIAFEALKGFPRAFHCAPAPDKRAFLREIIEKIEWDGENIHVFLFGESPE